MGRVWLQNARTEEDCRRHDYRRSPETMMRLKKHPSLDCLVARWISLLEAHGGSFASARAGCQGRTALIMLKTGHRCVG